jgi:fluoride exporter
MPPGLMAPTWSSGRSDGGGGPVAALDETAGTLHHPDSATGPSQAPVDGPKRSRPGRVPVAVLLAVCCGGVVGAVSRYLVLLALPTETGRFPLGTFVINVTGSALLGFLLVTLDNRFAERRMLRPLLGTGLIGAYTTFSTVSVEAVLLARAGRVLTAAIYVGLTVVCGLGAGLLGMTAARLSLGHATWRRKEA